MEPHREEEHKPTPPSAGPKPKRFRIVKLEERIAPGQVEPMGGTYTCLSPCTEITCVKQCRFNTERTCYFTQWHCR